MVIPACQQANLTTS